jgi:hypothetical protein
MDGMSSSRYPPTMDTLDLAFAEARRYLASLDTRPVASRGTPSDMRAPLPTHLPAQGLPATDVVRAIAAAAEPGLTGNAGGRFFAWVKGGALPARCRCNPPYIRHIPRRAVGVVRGARPDRPQKAVRDGAAPPVPL